LFAFLSSLLFAFRGGSPDSWGYQFLATSSGRPFSEALSAVLDEMIATRQLLEGQDGLRPNPQVETSLSLIGQGDTFSERVGLIEEVCNLSAIKGVPGIGRAVTRESQLARAAALTSPRLIDPSEANRTVVELTAAALAANPDWDKAVPTFLWLSQWGASDAG